MPGARSPGTANMTLVPARLAHAADGTLWSAEYDDIYHAAAGGLEQSRHVFLGGNDLPARWRGREAFTILETGFGCGLNFLATWAAWRDDPARCARLHFISVEKHPFARDDLRVIHRAWPELAPLSNALLAAWPPLVPGFHRLHFDDGRVTLTLLFGDAPALLPQLRARVDAFYLDGFAPAKNPELWSPEIFGQVGRLADEGATAATWSVAAAACGGLRDAGFDIDKRPGFAHKREMLAARRVRPVAAGTRRIPPSRALVIGAGLAGAGCAERLAARGWEVEVLERNAAPAQESSGNLAGVLRPLLSLEDNRLSRLARAGFLYARQHLAALEAAGLELRWHACGALQLARDAQHEETQRETIAAHAYPEDYARYVDVVEASRLAGHAASHGGWYFAGGGWVNPPSLARANLAHHADRVRMRPGAAVARLERHGELWRALDSDGALLAEAPLVILANASDMLRLGPPDLFAHLPLQTSRGQVSLVRERPGRALQCVVTQRGYATPALDGWHCAGASFARSSERELSRRDHDNNLARLDGMLPGFTTPEDAQEFAGRVGFRPASPDRRPFVGALPLARAAHSKPPTTLWHIERAGGVHVANGYGARGLVWSSLCAELLAAQLAGEPLPLEADLVDALDPGRFALRTAAAPEHSSED